MNSNKKLGEIGEQLAADFLVNRGFDILERNYRYKRAEIDIIGQKDNLLVFFEVKYRKNNSFGNPEDFVTGRKIELIQMASENYIEEIQWKGNIRFDIIGILKKSPSEIEHFEDAF